eukprot:jgi/Ulvmu1/4142/UM019_0121.1
MVDNARMGLVSHGVMYSAEQGRYRRYARRWLMLSAGFIINFALWTVCQPFVPNARNAAYLNVSLSTLHWLTYGWFITSAAAMVPGIWMLENLGLRKSTVISASLLVLGVALRCASYAHGFKSDPHKSAMPFIWILLGNMIVGIGSIPIKAGTSLIASSWFGEDSRGLANTLMCLAIPAGLHFNSLLHRWVESSGLEYSLQSARLLLVHVGIAAMALVCAPILRSAPPHKPCITAEHPCGVSFRPEEHACLSERSLLSPPSHPSSSVVSSLEGGTDTAALAHRLLRGHGRVRQGAWQDLHSLLTFWDFWVLLVAFSLTVGSFNVLHLLMEEFLDRNPDTGRIVGMHSIKVLGSFGAIAFPAGFIGLLLDRTQADKFIMSVSQAVVLAFATALAILSGSLLNVENAQACLICMAVMGFLVIPTALEMAAELAYPFSSAVSAGALWAGADTTVVLLGVTIDVAFAGDGIATTRFSAGGRWLLLACYALAALLWWIFPVRYARRAAERLFKEVQAVQSRHSVMHRPRGARSPNGFAAGQPWGEGHLERPLSRSLYIIDEEHTTMSTSDNLTQSCDQTLRGAHSSCDGTPSRDQSPSPSKAYAAAAAASHVAAAPRMMDAAATAAASTETLSIRLLASDQELTAAGRAGDRSVMSDTRTASRSASPGTTQDFRGSNTLSAASTRPASIDASSSSTRFSWRLPPFHLFQRAPSLQIGTSSGEISSRKLTVPGVAHRQLDLVGGTLSDALATNAASSATFAHHLHNSRSTAMPPEHLSDSSSYSDSSLGTAEPSSSLSAASYGTPVAAVAGRTIDSGSLSDDEHTGPCGNGVPSPRSQRTMHTTDADAELTVQEEPAGEVDQTAEAADGTCSTAAGDTGAGEAATPAMVSQLSSVIASCNAPTETASGRVVWWENPLGGNTVSGQSEAGAGSTVDTWAPPASESRDTDTAPQSVPPLVELLPEQVAATAQHAAAPALARVSLAARPPLPRVGAPVPAAPAADAGVQPQQNLDSLLRTSMMHSSQLFGSGRGGQSGVQQSSAILSTQDAVSALDMRMQHHEPVSSAFPVEDSVLLPGGAAGRSHASPSGPAVELMQRRPVASAMTADITTGITDPLNGIDIEMQHFAPTDELSQCMGADSSTVLPAPEVPSSERSCPLLPQPVVEDCSQGLDDDDSLPLPPLMVVERKEQRAPARSGRITQFQSKRRSSAAARRRNQANAQARNKAAELSDEPGAARTRTAAPAAAQHSSDMPPVEAGSEAQRGDSRELFASASSALSVDTAPSRSLTRSPQPPHGSAQRSGHEPERPANPIEQLRAGGPDGDVQVPCVQQARGVQGSQASSGVSTQLDDLTGDLMHPSCTYSLSVMNGSLHGSLSSLAASSSMQGQSSDGTRLEPGTPPRSREMQGGAALRGARGISPLELAREGRPSLRERFAAAAECVCEVDVGGNEGGGGHMGFAGLPLGKDEELPPTPSMPGTDTRALQAAADGRGWRGCPGKDQQLQSSKGALCSSGGLRAQFASKPAEPQRGGPETSSSLALESPYSSVSMATDLDSDNTNTWWSSIIEAAKVQDSAGLT